MKKNNRWSKYVYIVLVVVILVAGGLDYYKYWSRSGSQLNLTNSATSTPMQTISTSAVSNSNNSERLATGDLETYQNSAYGFQFKYPSNVYICPSPYPNSELAIGIRLDEACSIKDGTIISMRIMENTNNYSSAQGAFYYVFPEFATSSPYLKDYDFNNVTNFILGGLDAYGGVVPVRNNGNWVVQSNYYAVIFKNNRLFELSDDYYDVTAGGKPAGNKLVFDGILSTLTFDKTNSLWK